MKSCGSARRILLTFVRGWRSLWPRKEHRWRLTSPNHLNVHLDKSLPSGVSLPISRRLLPLLQNHGGACRQPGPSPTLPSLQNARGRTPIPRPSNHSVQLQVSQRATCQFHQVQGPGGAPWTHLFHRPSALRLFLPPEEAPRPRPRLLPCPHRVRYSLKERERRRIILTCTPRWRSINLKAVCCGSYHPEVFLGEVVKSDCLPFVAERGL